MRKTIILALLLACGATQAAEWVSVGKSTDGAEGFVDVSSIRVAGVIRRVWSKITYVPHTKQIVGKSVSYDMAHLEYNCVEGASRLDAMTLYFLDGTFDVMPDVLTPTAWAPVTPDTLRYQGMQFVCAWKPK
jgi:hypothetical protein